ncbi:hypothetical protein D3C77_463380 [compost metagenome]
MLQDIERKLLRVLFNFSRQKHRMPMWVELEYKMGHNKTEISAGLRRLVEQQYIFWPDNPDLSTLVILEMDDRDQGSVSERQGRGSQKSQYKDNQYSRSNLDYWTQY